MELFICMFWYWLVKMCMVNYQRLCPKLYIELAYGSERRRVEESTYCRVLGCSPALAVQLFQLSIWRHRGSHSIVCGRVRPPLVPPLTWQVRFYRCHRPSSSRTQRGTDGVKFQPCAPTDTNRHLWRVAVYQMTPYSLHRALCVLVQSCLLYREWHPIPYIGLYGSCGGI